MRVITAFKMLFYDRSTTAGSILGVVAIVFLVGQQLAVLFGLFTYMSVLVDHAGADIWVCSRNAENINSTDSIPDYYLDRISGISSIRWAEPLIFGGGSFRRADGKYNGVQVVGLRPPRMAGGPWKFARGSIDNLFEYDAVSVEQTDLDTLGYPEYGKYYEINGIKVKVNAITKKIKGFAGSLVFTNLVKAKEILNFPKNRYSAIMIKLKDGIDINSTVKEIQKILPNAKVISASDLSRKTRFYYIRNTGMGGSFGFSTLIGAMVGIVIIMLTMYTGVLNRQKDFAILRALGARKWDIAVIVFCQALIIGAAGIIIGFLLLSFFLSSTMNSKLPTYMPYWLPFYHAAFTLFLCFLGSLLAMNKAVSIEPASVFR